MTSPLIEQLTENYGYPQLNETNLSEVVDKNPSLVLFFAGNPDRYPESNDVAVILPELIKAFEGKFAAAVVLESDEKFVRDIYPFSFYPSLVFLRNGKKIGEINKVQDWIDYLEQIEKLLAQGELSAQSIPLNVIQETP